MVLLLAKEPDLLLALLLVALGLRAALTRTAGGHCRLSAAGVAIAVPTATSVFSRAPFMRCGTGRRPLVFMVKVVVDVLASPQ